MITFVGAARNIGNFALLTTSANRPLAMLQLDYIAQRKLEAAVVVACVIMFISLAGALLARLVQSGWASTPSEGTWTAPSRRPGG